MEGGAKWRPREMPHPPKADRRPAPARGCPSLTPRGGRLSGRKSIPILTQTEGNKGPLIPSSPSLPAWQSPVSAVGTRQLVACSGSPDPGVPALWEHRPKLGQVEKGCQGPPEGGPAHPHLPCATSTLIGLQRLASCTRPFHSQGHTPGQQSHAGWKGRTSLLRLLTRSTSPVLLPQRALAGEPDRHRTNPSSVARCLTPYSPPCTGDNQLLPHAGHRGG